MNSPISPILKQQGFVLLDGGLATELENRGHNLDGILWSARLLDAEPIAIRDIHRSYLEAGANCITAASYQASIPGFKAAGFSARAASNLIQKSVEIAVEARALYLEDVAGSQDIYPLVAASVGPYGAYLADGSEYSGHYAIKNDDLRAFHEPRWEILLNTPANLFAIETIPSFAEAIVLLELLEASPQAHAWVSFSCMDGQNINDGTPLAECAAIFAGCEQVIAIGVNCTAPLHISSLIKQTKIGAPGKAVIVYPNSGERYRGDNNTWEGCPQPTDFGEVVREWFNLGARLIGGCCRTTPGQISEIKHALTGKRI